jgi:hypothetical protein
VVEHLTHKLKIEGSNPAIGKGKRKQRKGKGSGHKLFTAFATAVTAISFVMTVSYGCFTVAQW